jgi:hypothetical protein
MLLGVLVSVIQVTALKRDIVELEINVTVKPGREVMSQL